MSPGCTWLLLAACAAAVAGETPEPEAGLTFRYLSTWLPDRRDLSSLGELYTACSRRDFNDSLAECFGGQVGSLLGRAARSRELPLAAGVSLVGPGVPDDARAGGTASLARMVADLLLSHPTVRVKLSDARSTYRKLKMKKMMLPFLVGVTMKVASFIPLVLGLMTLLGLKAFFTGNAALGIVALLGLHKLLFSGHRHVSSGERHKEVIHVAPTVLEHYPEQHHGYHHGYQSAEALELHSGPGVSAPSSSAEFFGGGGYHHQGGPSRRAHVAQQSVVLEPQDYKVASIPYSR